MARQRDLKELIGDNVTGAENDIILYSVDKGCATHKVEIGAIVANDLVESERTTFHYYDIGEPEITYVTMSSQNVTLEGNFANFAISDYLVLPRAEIQADDGESSDNNWYIDDTTPKSLDLNVGDGISLTASDAFILYGVVKQIPSTVRDGDHYFEYEIDDQISQIEYTITAPDASQTTTTRDVGLERHYTSSWKANSIYEFMHVFTVNSGTGTYTMNLVGLDSSGNEVSGSAENFQINVNWFSYYIADNRDIGMGSNPYL